jgi:hypothetical protein
MAFDLHRRDAIPAEAVIVEDETVAHGTRFKTRYALGG